MADLAKQKLNIYLRLLNYVKPYWGRFVIGLVLAMLVSSLEGLTAWLVKPVLDEVFIKQNLFMLKILPFLLVGVYLLKGLSRYGQSYLMAYIGQRVVMRVRSELYNHIQGMSLRFFQQRPSAELMSRVINDVDQLARLSSQTLVFSVRQICTLLALLFVVFYQDWRLATISLLVLPLIGLLLVRIGQKLRQVNRRKQERVAEMNTVLQEAFTGTKIVKAFGREAYESQRFNRVNRRIYDFLMKDVRLNEMTSPLMEFIGAVGMAGALWYGGSQVIAGRTTPGTFFSFLAALMMLYGPIRKLSQISNGIQQAMASVDRVFEILDLSPEVTDKPGAVMLQTFRDTLRFDDVSFCYLPDPKLVLKHINLTIHKGEMIALVGMSGAGKSTFVDLIPRFHDVTEGRILIDGLDIREITLQSLRAQIGMVTQGTILFNDTIEHNIAYGRAEATKEEIRRAAQLAFAHDFIQEMPEGYETMIGERGVRLSGGQRQRIAIARAFLKDAPILILDEATSELDSESEFMLQKALANLLKGRTAIVIAHRLSTVINADRIVVFHQGEIVEIGRHEELLSRGGLYARLYEIQFHENTRR